MHSLSSMKSMWWYWLEFMQIPQRPLKSPVPADRVQSSHVGIV